MVTNTTTPTVTPSPSPSVTSSESDETSKDGHNKSAEILDSYRQMTSLMDSQPKQKVTVEMRLTKAKKVSG